MGAASPWIDRFTKHAVHAAIASVEESLETASAIEENDVHDVGALTRVRSIVNHVKHALKASDPALVAMTTLDSIESGMVNLRGALDAHTATPQDPGHLTNAQTYAESAIAVLGALPVPRTRADVERIGEVARSFQETVLGRLAAVDKQVDETLALLKAHVAKLESDTSLARDDITASIAELETNLATTSDGLKKELGAIATDIESQKTRLDAALSQFSSTSTAAEAERAKHFNDAEAKRLAAAGDAEEQRRASFVKAAEEQGTLFDSELESMKEKVAELTVALSTAGKTRQEESEQLQKQAKKDFDTLGASMASDANVVLSKLKEEQAKAEKIVHVIGNTGMVGGYQKAANGERNAMWFWQVVACVGLIGLVVGAILVAAAFKDITWPGLIGRVFVASAFGALAAYAGRQASVHRATMLKQRRMQLELSSIDPYLALLSEEKRAEVKLALAYKWFGQPDENLSKEDRENAHALTEGAKGALESMKTTAEGVTKLLTAAKKAE